MGSETTTGTGNADLQGLDMTTTIDDYQKAKEWYDKYVEYCNAMLADIAQKYGADSRMFRENKELTFARLSKIGSDIHTCRSFEPIVIVNADKP
jgi:hypothetical protein